MFGCNWRNVGSLSLKNKLAYRVIAANFLQILVWKIRIHAFKMGDFNTSFVQHLRRWFDVCCAIIFQLHPPGVYERTKETCARRPRLHLGCRYLCKIKVQQKYPTKIRNFPSSRLIMDGFFSLIWRKFDPFSFQLSWQAPWVHGYPPPTVLLRRHRPKINITGRPKAHSARQSEGPFWSQIRHKYISYRRQEGP